VPQAFAKLSLLAEQRGDAYANADVRVSLEGMLDAIDGSPISPDKVLIPRR
jgi:hypothetical protein